MKIGCKNPEAYKKLGLNASHKTKITLEQSSYITRHLLRPASHSASIAIHCDAPSAIKLAWA